MGGKMSEVASELPRLNVRGVRGRGINDSLKAEGSFQQLPKLVSRQPSLADEMRVPNPGPAKKRKFTLGKIGMQRGASKVFDDSEGYVFGHMPRLPRPAHTDVQPIGERAHRPSWNDLELLPE
jgi:hypothetical protein